jgi:transglutaminase-like putative cysteine protease
MIATCSLVFFSCVSEATSPASRTFEFRYEVIVPSLPPSAETAYLWIPHPVDDSDQTIRDLRIETDLLYEIVTEPKYGNTAVRFDLTPGGESERVVISFEVTRRERINRPEGVNPKRRNSTDTADRARWLQPSRRVPLDSRIRRWAEETVAGQATQLGKARAIYDYAVSNLRYDKSGTGWGQGDIYFACDEKRGNCTDFHSLFIGYTRSVGIPARFEMGFPIPTDRGEGEVDGYHCWADFYIDGYDWIPVDASEANKHPEKRDYYFGAHDENRVLFTIGRDITFPGMRGNPLNYFIYPYAEIDGRRLEELGRRFRYRDVGVR